jgi:hypothetical protein
LRHEHVIPRRERLLAGERSQTQQDGREDEQDQHRERQDRATLAVHSLGVRGEVRHREPM